MSTGTLYGVGVGPGDPELLTLKALRIITATPVIAYPANPDGESRACATVAHWLSPAQRQIPIRMPFQNDRMPALQAYQQAAAELTTVLEGGQDAAVLCEGDPLLYGSFIHLHTQLARFSTVVIPGISSIGAAAAVAQWPLATGTQRIAIVPASAGETLLREALTAYDCIAILKPGRWRQRILALLRETGRIGQTVYVEQATQQAQRIVTDVATLPAAPGPYFALFLIGTGAAA